MPSRTWPCEWAFAARANRAHVMRKGGADLPPPPARAPSSFTLRTLVELIVAAGSKKGNTQ